MGILSDAIIDISNKLVSLTNLELLEVSAQIDIVKARTTEKLVESKDCLNGQVLRRFQTFDRDGKKLGERKIEWTYYDGLEGKRPVHFIRIRHYDASGNELIGQGLEIEHLSGGEVILRSI